MQINDDNFRIIYNFIRKREPLEIAFKDILDLYFVEEKILWINNFFRWIWIAVTLDGNINPLKKTSNKIIAKLKSGENTIIQLDDKEELLKIFNLLIEKCKILAE